MGEAMLFPATALPSGAVQVGSMQITPRNAMPTGAIKVAVRPEAWQIHRNGAGMAAKLVKLAYLGSFFEYSFDTELGKIFVVSPDLTDVLPLGAEVKLSWASHGVSVVAAT